MADGVRVRQVLFNLLSNASKFTGEGGTIILSALSTRAPLAPPADRAGDERKLVTKDVVWVSVADTGIGIAPEDMAKLFQEFSQVDSSASRQAQGTGLGLALCKKFVEMHGGTIGAESLPGPGLDLLVHPAGRRPPAPQPRRRRSAGIRGLSPV